MINNLPLINNEVNIGQHLFWEDTWEGETGGWFLKSIKLQQVAAFFFLGTGVLHRYLWNSLKREAETSIFLVF